MDEMYDELKGMYTMLQPGSVTEEEVSHNRRRSTFVSSRISKMSMRHLLDIGNN